jgi:UPF0271 protein
LVARIDLNCDLGEEVGDDAAVLPFVTSVSIACGLHAGGPATMRHTLEAAIAAGVAVGAHPSFADRAGFGRQAMELPAADIGDLVLYQVGALAAMARANGVRLQHVKLHGALYHVAAARADVASAVVRAVAVCDPHLVVVGPPASRLADAARAAGLRFAGELFADRQYGDDGRLLPRSQPHALLALDPATSAARALAMVRDRALITISGARISTTGETLCLHGDDPQVIARAQALRAAFAAAGVLVAPLGSWL